MLFKKTVCVLMSGLFLVCAEVSSAANTSTAIQFDASKQQWNRAGTPIKNMPLIRSIVSVGKFNFAFGCGENPGTWCKLGLSELVSIHSSSGWTTAGHLAEMSHIFPDAFYPADPTFNVPNGWILGAYGVGIGFAYFDGTQFLDGDPFFALGNSFNDKLLKTSVTNFPVAVSHGKFWFFNGDKNGRHESQWTSDIHWHTARMHTQAPVC